MSQNVVSVLSEKGAPVADPRMELWRELPYTPGAYCDLCSSTDNVKGAVVPFVASDPERPFVETRFHHRWSLCDTCFAQGSGLLSTRSVDGALVYLRVTDDGDVRRNRLVLVPPMFRDRPI